jgi:crotonobetainyl-CoA:carnitine CoA-transferase CaiB-like acyl-CoA transferase
MFAALAVVAALAATPGTGRYIDVSMTESVLSWNSMAVTSAVTGADGGPRGGEPAYGLFRTADGWITLSIAHEDHFWRALCEALESPDRALLTRGERHAARDELRSWLAAALESASSAEWLERLEAAGVPAGRVNDPRSTLDDPLFRDRGAFQTIDGQLYVLTPMMLDGRRLPVTGPAPGVGEHTRDYLLEVGYGESEVDQLAAEGAVMLGAGQA